MLIKNQFILNRKQFLHNETSEIFYPNFSDQVNQKKKKNPELKIDTQRREWNGFKNKTVEQVRQC